jgi:YHS domain-containing protein
MAAIDPVCNVTVEEDEAAATTEVRRHELLVP